MPEIKRILCVGTTEPDFGAAYLYHGLVRVLGKENVYECPTNPLYHTEEKMDSCNLGKGYTNPFDWMPCYDQNPSPSQLKQFCEAGVFDLIVLMSPCADSVKQLRWLLEHCQEGNRPVVVIHDSTDDPAIGQGVLEEFGAPLMFKRLIKEETETVKPMPFSVPADRLPKSLAAEQVDTDITCCSRLHHISRVDVFEMLRGLTEKYTVFAALGSMSLGNGRGLSWHLYMRQLAQSRIGISVRGFTRDMSSYWEIPATGALMLCDSDKDLHPHALVDGKHMVVYRNVGDLKEKLCYYLEHEDERAEIAERGRAHVLEHHTCEARAKWVLDCVKGVLT